MASGVEELLDMLFEMIDEAKNLPLSGDKCVIERDRALDLIDDVRSQFPMELTEARKMMARRAELAKVKAAQAQAGYTVTGEGDPEIDALVRARGEAKQAKNFAEADRIRDELKARGIEITDVPGGAVWKRV